MPNPTRTPGPWRIEGGALRGADGRSIAWTNYASRRGCSQRIDYDEKEANAAFIVEACNSHDRLTAQVEALKGVLRSIADHATEFYDVEDFERMMLRVTEQARAALAASE